MLELRVGRRVGDLDLELSLQVGDEPVLVAGPNGAGKSSLLRMILGVLRPERGRIALDGRVLFDAEQGIDLPVEERALGYVPQDYAVFPHLTVLKDVAF